MTDSIATELKNIKAEDKNLHQHLKQVIASLVVDRSSLAQLEAYSAQQRISGGTQECVYKVREAYSHLRDYEIKHRTLLGVRSWLLRNLTQEQRQSLRSLHP